VLAEVGAWCDRRGVTNLAELIGVAHG
jgi:hypothetical protein